jgi:TatD DNase family protein
MLRLYDAHNHLQDERFGGGQEALIAACRAEGIAAMVVNGASEADWPAVAELARRHPDLVLPAFGYHPWYVAERTPTWRERLLRVLDETAGATVGEIGLDRWKPGLDFADQEAVFREQLHLAAERNLPVSIHCLQAWGRLLEILRAGPRPARGFLLHSFGGPAELVPELARLGAYFSLPGYFAHTRKARQRDTFRHVPAERLLLETDAPDQPLPAERVKYAWPGAPVGTETAAHPLNHPANLGAVYAFAAELLGRPLADLAAQVEANFIRLFGRPPARATPAPASPPAAPPPAPPPQSQTSR